MSTTSHPVDSTTLTYVRIRDLDPVRRDCHPADAIVCRADRLAETLLKSGWLTVQPDIAAELQRALLNGACTDGMERTLGIAIENMEDHRLATVAEALHHAQAAEKAMDTLRPYLDSRGQFVADIVHAATVGIGKLTVPDLYQAGAR